MDKGTKGKQGTPPKTGKAWLWNGKTFKPARSLPISDRASRYGMALFESFPVYNGKPVFLGDHLERLKAACIRCGFHLDFDAFDGIAAILGTIRFDAFARIYVTGGDGGPISAATRCRIFIMAEPREPMQEAVLESGYRLGIHPGSYSPVFSGTKTGNYWANIHARQIAIERQNHEALLFNEKGQLISASMANVFVANKGGIRTPSLECGARDGVMRRWALDRCEAQECCLLMEDVMQADEIFLTSSGIGIMPAIRVEAHSLSSRHFSTPLRNEYNAYLSCHCGI